jgi:FKBP-type peptidyl-prolyl cis-trans isomerase
MNTRVVTGIVVVLSLIVVGIFFTLFGGWYGLFGSQSQTVNEQLVAQDLVVGTGAEAALGQTIEVHYIGRLQTGQIIDSSRERNEPLRFTLGAGDVIRGWDEGLVGMRVGGKRVLVVPPSYGYGAQAIGPIPPNSTLIFEIELLGVEAPAGTQ